MLTKFKKISVYKSEDSHGNKFFLRNSEYVPLMRKKYMLAMQVQLMINTMNFDK